MKNLTKYQQLIEMGREKVRKLNEINSKREEAISKKNAETDDSERGCLEFIIENYDKKRKVIAHEIGTIAEVGSEIFRKMYDEVSKEIYTV